MRIESIQLIGAAGAPGAPESLLVSVASDDGLVGLGEIGAVSEASVDAIEEAVGDLALLALGRSPLEREPIWHAACGVARGWKRDRVVMARALSGLDAALWDLAARTLGVPCVVLMGGATRARLELCVHCGDAADDAALEAADGLLSEGVYAFSFDVDSADPQHVQGLRRARKTLKQQALIAVRMSSPAAASEQAIELGAAIDRMDPYWIEGLLRDGRWADLAGVRKAVAGAIGAGASVVGIRSFQQALEAECADILIPSLVLCGGPTGALKAADLTHLRGARMSVRPGDTLVSVLGCAHVSFARPSVSPLSVSLESYRALRETAPDTIQDGFLLLPDGAGIGLEASIIQSPRPLTSFSLEEGDAS